MNFRDPDFSAVEGDNELVIAVQLTNDDGTHPNLEGETVTLRVQNVDTTAVNEVTGLIGDNEGNVSGVLDGELIIAGRWLVDWRIDGGRTYPSPGEERKTLLIRSEVE